MKPGIRLLIVSLVTGASFLSLADAKPITLENSSFEEGMGGWKLSRGMRIGRTVSGIELGAASRAEIADGKLSVTLPAAGFAIIRMGAAGERTDANF